MSEPYFEESAWEPLQLRSLDYASLAFFSDDPFGEQAAYIAGNIPKTIKNDRNALQTALEEASDVISVAFENIGEKISASWYQAYTQKTSDRIDRLAKSPRRSIRMALSEATDVVEADGVFDLPQLFSAIALWHLGEFVERRDELEEAAWHLAEAALALEIASRYEAFKQAERAKENTDDAVRLAAKVSLRNSKAALKRHEPNRRRKAEAHAFWLAGSWATKADAARKIEQKFSVAFRTAEEWVGEWDKARNVKP